MILAIVTLWYPDYEIERWQQWIIYGALIWLAISLNIFGSSFIPMFNQLIFILAVLTLSSTTIVLLVVSRNRYSSGSWIFSDTTNSTGWPSDGFSFILSISNAVYSFLGSDCGAHLCEEIQNPGRNVPKVMLYPLDAVVEKQAARRLATGTNPSEIWVQWNRIFEVIIFCSSLILLVNYRPLTTNT
jgi:choline transport protein